MPSAVVALLHGLVSGMELVPQSQSVQLTSSADKMVFGCQPEAGEDQGQVTRPLLTCQAGLERIHRLAGSSLRHTIALRVRRCVRGGADSNASGKRCS
jgi:hypothetical protein